MQNKRVVFHHWIIWTHTTFARFVEHLALTSVSITTTVYIQAYSVADTKWINWMKGALEN